VEASLLLIPKPSIRNTANSMRTENMRPHRAHPPPTYGQTAAYAASAEPHTGKGRRYMQRILAGQCKLPLMHAHREETSHVECYKRHTPATHVLMPMCLQSKPIWAAWHAQARTPHDHGMPCAQ
jgi:hypothetical protein